MTEQTGERPKKMARKGQQMRIRRVESSLTWDILLGMKLCIIVCSLGS